MIGFWLQEVEREISFRTEQGLYYSYFKHLVKAPTLSQGIAELRQDNLTEHTNTINIWKRFNIYQELFLAFLHRYFFHFMEPILFYVEFVFNLQGFHAAMLFLISWSLSGTWVSGVLTMALLLVHRNEITRVPFTVPLREHFSLPFFYAMVVSIARHFKLCHHRMKNPPFWNSYQLSLVQVYLMTFLQLVTWQFAPFALLLHSIVCFVLATLQMVAQKEVIFSWLKSVINM